jgi:hypothetical protein
MAVSLKQFIFIFLIALGVQSCVNDIQKIKKITFKSTDPDEKTADLVLTYTDSGQAKIRLIAPLAESFAKPEKIIKFREGIKLEFYTKKGALLSTLTAKYGEIDDIGLSPTGLVHKLTLNDPVYLKSIELVKTNVAFLNSIVT